MTFSFDILCVRVTTSCRFSERLNNTKSLLIASFSSVFLRLNFSYFQKMVDYPLPFLVLDQLVSNLAKLA